MLGRGVGAEPAIDARPADLSDVQRSVELVGLSDRRRHRPCARAVRRPGARGDAAAPARWPSRKRNRFRRRLWLLDGADRALPRGIGDRLLMWSSGAGAGHPSSEADPYWDGHQRGPQPRSSMSFGDGAVDPRHAHKRSAGQRQGNGAARSGRDAGRLRTSLPQRGGAAACTAGLQPGHPIRRRLVPKATKLAPRLFAKMGPAPVSAGQTMWGGRDSNPRPRDYESPALTG